MRGVISRDARGETIVSRAVVFACAASAGAHAGLVPAHLQSEPVLGAAFIAAVVLLVGAVAAVVGRPGDRRVTSGVALLLAGLVLAYLATRSTGIPGLDPQREAVDAVGVATVTVEAIGLVFAVRPIQPVGRHRRPPQLQEVTR